MALLDKLAMIKLRFDDVAQQIIEPEVIADMKRYVKLNKEYKDLMPIVEAYKATKQFVIISMSLMKFLSLRMILK